MTTFFELYDLFIYDKKTINSKKIVLSLFDQLVYQQADLKQKLGESFPSILADTIELLKDNVMTNYKSDFDDILEQLNEKAEKIPELKLLLTELADKHE